MHDKDKFKDKIKKAEEFLKVFPGLKDECVFHNGVGDIIKTEYPRMLWQLTW